jgi:hypothetical protein
VKFAEDREQIQKDKEQLLVEKMGVKDRPSTDGRRNH